MDKMDREVLSHVDAEEFELSDEEISKHAFDVAGQILDNVKELPQEHKETVINNAMRIHSNVGFLLSELDLETVYWKQ